MEEPLARFVEDVALFWEGQGLPRIAGRIMGFLMICDPPYRSSKQLADELGVSKASVSTMTRLLLTSASLQAVAVPGDRATFYALTKDSFETKFQKRIQTMVGFRELAERGLALLGEDAPKERTARLKEIASLYGFLERELPRLIERWQEEKTHD